MQNDKQWPERWPKIEPQQAQDLSLDKCKTIKAHITLGPEGMKLEFEPVTSLEQKCGED